MPPAISSCPARNLRCVDKMLSSRGAQTARDLAYAKQMIESSLASARDDAVAHAIKLLQISRTYKSIRSRHDCEYVSVMSDKPSKLKIADREFTSRLLVGTGKFSSNEAMRDALIASGTEIVTVALRRADLSGKHDPFANILDFIDPKKFLLLPNTSGARDAT